MLGASIFAKIPLEVTTVNAEKDTNKQQLDMVVKVCIMSILFMCMYIPGINCDL